MQVESAVELHLHVTPILLRWSPGLKTPVTHKMDMEGDKGGGCHSGLQIYERKTGQEDAALNQSFKEPLDKELETDNSELWGLF